MEIIRDLDECLWREFVDRHPHSQVFHTPEMFQVFAHTKGYRPSLWAAVGLDNRPKALLLPVEITLMRGPLRSVTSRAVVYGSVLCAPGAEGREALRELLRTYRRAPDTGFLFTELRNLSDLSELQPVLEENGFVFEEHLNFILDLRRSQEEIWSNVHAAARRNIRKSRNLRVAIEEVTDPQRIPAIYTLLKAIYQRLHVPLVDASLFQSAFEILRPQGMMQILVARVENVDIGALTLLLHKDIVYYWYTGTLREFSAYRAGDLLVWHALEWGREHGCRILDFGGAGKPDEEYGVRDFKAKFGGTLVNYGRNVCVHAPLAYQLSMKVYQIARRFL